MKSHKYYRRREAFVPEGLRAKLAWLFKKTISVFLVIYRSLSWLLHMVAAYAFIIFVVFLLGYAGVFLFAVVGLVHFINSKRGRILDMYPRRRVAFILNILFLAHIGIIATFIGVPIYFGVIMSWYKEAAIFAVAVLFCVRSARKTGAWFPPPLKVMAFVSIATILVINFDALPMPRVTKRILKQESVRPVLMNPGLQKKLGLPVFDIATNDMQRLVSDSEDRFIYVSLSYFSAYKSGVIQIDLDDLTNIRMLELPGCMDFAMNAGEDLMYVSGLQKCEIYVVRIPEFELERTIPVKKKCWPNIEDIVLYEKEGFLLVNEEGNRIYKIDIEPGEIERIIRTPLRTMVDVMKRNPVSGRTYASGDLFLSVFGELDRNVEKYTRKRIFYWGMDFAFSPTGSSAYLNNSWTGYLYELDLKTFKVVRKIFVAPGLRDVAYDDSRGLIYIGNFATGRVFAIDEKTGGKVAVLDFGKRVRDILITRKNHRMFVLSGYGLFEVDIDGVLCSKGWARAKCGKPRVQ